MLERAFWWISPPKELRKINAIINENFICGDDFIDIRNGRTYKTVEIGTQCWFAENLNYEAGNSWCYENNKINCEKYGRLYNWHTATVICPFGWSLPDYVQWEELVKYLGAQDVGGKLKEGGTSHWEVEKCGDSLCNSSRFTALPAGLRAEDGSFMLLGSRTSFWSFTPNRSWRLLANSSGIFPHHVADHKSGMSVRCIKRSD